MISRRDFLINSVASGSLLVHGATNLKDSTSDLYVNKVNISLKDLPDNFRSFKIAFLSDAHIGDCSSSALLEQAVKLTKSEKPDLLILGGDYINSLDMGLNRFFYYYRYASKEKQCNKNVPSFKESLDSAKKYFRITAEIVRQINPEFGIIAVLGNHDRWNNAQNCIDIFKDQGISILVNQGLQLDRNNQIIEIYGADDYSTGIPKIPAASQNFRIIVSHNPDFLEEIGEKTNYSLGLAGHTHGGQISLPILGTVFSNIQYPQLIQGLNYSSAGNPIYTSAGIGTSGLPIRLNCPPELSILSLDRL